MEMHSQECWLPADHGACVAAMTLKSQKPRPKFFQDFQSSNQHSTVVKSPFFKKTCFLWERFPVGGMFFKVHDCSFTSVYISMQVLVLDVGTPIWQVLVHIAPLLVRHPTLKKNGRSYGLWERCQHRTYPFQSFSGIKPYQTVPFLGMILSQSHKYWIAGIRIPRCQTLDRIHGFQDSWSIWNMLKQMLLWNVWVVQWDSYVSLCICVYISFMWSSKCLSIKQNLGTACLLELPASNTAAKKTAFRRATHHMERSMKTAPSRNAGHRTRKCTWDLRTPKQLDAQLRNMWLSV